MKILLNSRHLQLVKITFINIKTDKAIKTIICKMNGTKILIIFQSLVNLCKRLFWWGELLIWNIQNWVNGGFSNKSLKLLTCLAIKSISPTSTRTLLRRWKVRFWLSWYTAHSSLCQVSISKIWLGERSKLSIVRRNFGTFKTIMTLSFLILVPLSQTFSLFSTQTW